MSKFYLLCAPDSKLEEMRKDLDTIDIRLSPLLMVNLRLNSEKLDYLKKNLHNYDYVVINSPSAIEMCLDALSNATNATFLTVGEVSGTLLNKKLPNLVLFPKHDSGSDALWAQVMSNLNLVDKRILLIRGDLGKNLISSYLDTNNLNYDEVELYQHILPNIDNLYLKKNLENSLLQGIIITSSLLVTSLFDQAMQMGYTNELRQCRFITLDSKVANLLKQFGVVEVYITLNANRAELVNLIRGLDDSSSKIRQ